MKSLFFAFACVFFLSSCATKTGLDLKHNDTKPPISWTVNERISDVYKEYKNYSEKNFSGGDFLWSGGRRVRGDFFGMDEGAEIDIKMEGNPLAPITYLHIELSADGDKTDVQVWYYNNYWKNNAEEFRDNLF